MITCIEYQNTVFQIRNSNISVDNLKEKIDEIKSRLEVMGYNVYNCNWSLKDENTLLFFEKDSLTENLKSVWKEEEIER